MNRQPDIVKISEATRRAKNLGLPLTAYTIRKALQDGRIPCRIVGNTYLFSWQTLVDWITCTNDCDNNANGFYASMISKN